MASRRVPADVAAGLASLTAGGLPTVLVHVPRIRALVQRVDDGCHHLVQRTHSAPREAVSRTLDVAFGTTVDWTVRVAVTARLLRDGTCARGTTVAAIAARAEVTQQTLYLAWGSKRAPARRRRRRRHGVGGADELRRVAREHPRASRRRRGNGAVCLRAVSRLFVDVALRTHFYRVCCVQRVGASVSPAGSVGHMAWANSVNAVASRSGGAASVASS